MVTSGSARISVHLIYDPDSQNWCFRVPSLGAIGDAATREEAMQRAAEATAFALEYDDDPVGEIDYLQVTVGPHEHRVGSDRQLGADHAQHTTLGRG